MLQKKQPFFLLLAIWFTVLLYTVFTDKRQPDVYVDSYLQPQLDRLDSILAVEGIELDLSGVDKIVVMPLMRGKQGVYYRDGRIIVINASLTLPDGLMLLGPAKEFKKRADDYLLTVLAHEIAHSIGINHVDDANSLMWPSDMLFGKHLTTIGPEELILRTYRCIEELKVSNPLD